MYMLLLRLEWYRYNCQFLHWYAGASNCELGYFEYKMINQS